MTCDMRLNIKFTSSTNQIPTAAGATGPSLLKPSRPAAAGATGPSLLKPSRSVPRNLDMYALHVLS